MDTGKIGASRADGAASGASRADGAKKKDLRQEQAKLRQACADFEAVMLNQMFESMRSSLSKSDLFGGSLARDIYESMYYRQVSEDIARSDKNMGLGEAMYMELKEKIK
ncbi:MAG: rod-binding protein [Thermodesulfobacteriota bacterium]